MELLALILLSYKLITNANMIIFNIQICDGSLVCNQKNASDLSKIIYDVSEYFNRTIVIVTTYVNIPFGSSIGGALEVREICNFFDGTPNSKLEQALRELILYLNEEIS